MLDDDGEIAHPVTAAKHNKTWQMQMQNLGMSPKVLKAFDRVGPIIKVSTPILSLVPVLLRLPHGTPPQVSLRLQHGIPCQSKSTAAPVRTQVWAESDDITLHADMPHTAMASSSPWAICPPHWHTTLAHHSGRC